MSRYEPSPSPSLRGKPGGAAAGVASSSGPMLCRLWLLLAAALAVAPPAAPARSSIDAPRSTLKLATWNLEWLLTPAGFNALKNRCTPAGDPQRHRQRSIPCDVAANLERSATDVAAMARYARQLDADVIAVQEADGVEAARQVFPGYEFCFTGGPAVQNTGFAIRRGLPFRCGADLTALSLGDSVRRGATLVLYPGTRRELHLLGVHLKSGCARAQLDTREHSCERLARQAPALHDWLAGAARAGNRYVVLGDFNRDLLAESALSNHAPPGGLWEQLQEGGSDLVFNTAQGQPFHNCHIGQPHTGYIDYILPGNALKAQLIAGSFERLTYSAGDAWRLKLSDHCPVAIKLSLD
ncbi:MAG: endonuclease/exonuclease/phosphatase family protein [Steroidobacteraceae bacterium]